MPAPQQEPEPEEPEPEPDAEGIPRDTAETGVPPERGFETGALTRALIEVSAILAP